MTETRLSIRRPLELMQQLQQCADQRAAEEAALAADFQAETSLAQEEFEAAVEQLNESHAERRRELENAYAEAKRNAVAEFDQAQLQSAQELAAATSEIERRGRDVLEKAQGKCDESQWEALAVFDGKKDQPELAREEAHNRIQSYRQQGEGLRRDARSLMQMQGLAKVAASIEVQRSDAAAQRADTAAAHEAVADAEAQERLKRLLAESRELVLRLQNLRLASLLLGNGRSAGWVVLTTLVGAAAGGIAGDLSPVAWATGAVAGAAIGGVAIAALRPRARRQAAELFAEIVAALAEKDQLVETAIIEVDAGCDAQAAAIAAERDREVAAAQRLLQESVSQSEKWQAMELSKAQAAADKRIAELTARRDEISAAADREFPPQLEDNAEAHVLGDREAASEFERRRALAVRQRDERYAAMADAWRRGFQEVADQLEAMQLRKERFFPDWSKTDWEQWKRPERPPEAIAFGDCVLDMQMVKNGISADEKLQPDPTRLMLPVVMSRDERPSMAITAAGAGRARAVETLQLTLLRFITAMPAGKLRLTLIDAAGLGKNFAALMHLNDFDEQFTGGRIWTEGKQINDRLSLISDHMEKTLQKYLRNEFASIDEYNEHAGEVAEPYHVVVVANFPAGFNDATASKLATIAAAGPRCGVYTLLSVDKALPMPHGFNVDELLTDAVHLDWVDGRMVWRYPLYEKLPLQLDASPPAETLTRVLRGAAEQSREASRVEVPFDVVAPETTALWSCDSGRELSVPIGRAGAKELQSMRLGRGTSQHVLISGKTGSGKSTLLHALITNLALHYGPDQVEFYLVDFKKGVEFKTYAANGLPHARVIAVESEREFGLSVLERLDAELGRRGELFRSQGVQDLAAFRAAAPDQIMPRTLLIVDEFQELFVTDDRLAQDAALLLDRLVRQGRAFGIHVLLGSQTLAGAYSLARSTLGQMAVRIALECSESDAHLILSDDNTAARLLSRPGEAIYNDQNGLTAGNHPFQVVWLPDQQRQQYLAELNRLPTDQRAPTSDPTIVFEGNLPADVRDNAALAQFVAGEAAATVPEPTLWVGSAVRIEPPTQLVLRRQGGHNLAIVGAQEPLAMGILATAVVAAATQQQGLNAQFTILDGARPESSQQGVWEAVAAALGADVELHAPRDAAAAIVAIADEAARRNESPDEIFAPRYLVVHDLAQFRDLRISDEDFGFSFSGGDGKPPATDKRFRELLREGPAVGIHVLLWCESYNSLTRSIDRLALRDIEFRVALPMSAADSTSFIDSPAAGRLGEHRAILYRDDLGTEVKFRPYASPNAQWLAEVEAARSPQGDGAKRVSQAKATPQ